MKVLWVVNIMLPAIAQELGLSASNREGWLSGLFGRMMNNSDEYKLSIAYPVAKNDSENRPPVVALGEVDCYAFFEDLSHPEIYDSALDNELSDIIEKVNPDILHIFGTEFPHGLAAAKIYNRPERTLVGIQGICTLIARDYMAELPMNVQNEVTFRDWLKKDSLRQQKEKFEKRGENETKLLKMVSHITGRTDFDRKFSEEVNSSFTYYKMNETMRSSFYSGGLWNLDNVKPHSIFLGQGDYPIKGMHFLLEAVSKLVDEYPDLTVNVAGNSIINRESLKDLVKTPAYGKYLLSQIKKYKLESKIKVLGSLSEEEIKNTYLNNSVFVCSSYIENSPNMVAEAMLLGMPVVTTNAGGICSVISENEGIIVQKGNSDELACAIRKVWMEEDCRNAALLSRCSNAHERALVDYDGSQNYNRLLEIYSQVFN